MASMGSPITRATCVKPLEEVSLNPWRPMTRASIRDVVILETSAGWNFTGPSSNQECEPLTSRLRKITSTSSTSTAR